MTETVLPPNFPAVRQHPPPDFSTIIPECATKFKYSFEKKDWQAEQVMIKLDTEAFARGGLRLVYHLLDEAENDLVHQETSQDAEIEAANVKVNAVDDGNGNSNCDDNMVNCNNNNPMLETNAEDQCEGSSGRKCGNRIKVVDDNIIDKKEDRLANNISSGNSSNSSNSSSSSNDMQAIHATLDIPIAHEKASKSQAVGVRFADTCVTIGNGSGPSSKSSNSSSNNANGHASNSALSSASVPKQSIVSYVAKISMDPNDNLNKDIYFQDVQMQTLAKEFAQKYNECNPPKKVDFVKAWILRLDEREGSPICGVERYIDGPYKKYNNNWDWVSLDDRNTPQAFSHFTYEISNHKLLICDIQGVNDMYTDPQIHSVDTTLVLGKGNLGKRGMDKFLRTHRCNKICQYLKLPSINANYNHNLGTLPVQAFMSGDRRVVDVDGYLSRQLSQDILQTTIPNRISTITSIPETQTATVINAHAKNPHVTKDQCKYCGDVIKGKVCKCRQNDNCMCTVL
jgi:hypothetical protein